MSNEFVIQINSWLILIPGFRLGEDLARAIEKITGDFTIGYGCL